MSTRLANARFKGVAAYPELAITQLGIADFTRSDYSRLLFISGLFDYCFLVVHSFWRCNVLGLSAIQLNSHLVELKLDIRIFTAKFDWAPETDLKFSC